MYRWHGRQHNRATEVGGKALTVVVVVVCCSAAVVVVVICAVSIQMSETLHAKCAGHADYGHAAPQGPSE